MTRIYQRALLLTILILAVPATSLAASPLESGSVDLLTDTSIQYDGGNAGDGAGFSVASAGDVNGDGKNDFIVGARLADNTGINAGSAYVVFGGSPSLDLSAVGSRGFRIDGAAAGDLAGFSVSGAGDVNGDGKADVIVGAPGADPQFRPNAGAAYVVFGRSSTATVSLASLGSGGFTIQGGQTGNAFGTSVAAAGDQNADGVVDVVIGAPTASPQGRLNAGSAFIIHGKSSSTTVDTASLGVSGSVINGAAAGDNFGYSVAKAGLVNSDTKSDLVIGAPRADNNGRTDSGSTYVVYGGSVSGALDTAGLPAVAGFRIDGAAAGDQSGFSVANAGLFNGDSFNDLVIGAPFSSAGGPQDSGAVYVVSNRSTNLDLASGAGVVRYTGSSIGDQLGSSVAGAADVNGDKRDDVVAGASGAARRSRTDNGAAYVLYGATNPSGGSISSLGNRGVALDGPENFCQEGVSVAFGDANADGIPDVASGGSLCSPAGRDSAGSVHIVVGFKPSVVTPPPPPPAKDVSSARLVSKTGCVKSSSFKARVSGTFIKDIRFYVDGRKVRTVTGKQSAAITIKTKHLKTGLHHIKVLVHFTSGADRSSVTLKSTFQKCRVRPIAPHQTG